MRSTRLGSDVGVLHTSFCKGYQSAPFRFAHLREATKTMDDPTMLALLPLGSAARKAMKASRKKRMVLVLPEAVGMLPWPWNELYLDAIVHDTQIAIPFAAISFFRQLWQAVRKRFCRLGYRPHVSTDQGGDMLCSSVHSVASFIVAGHAALLASNTCEVYPAICT